MTSSAAIRRPAWAEVDLAAISHNARVLADLVAPARLCAVVKADGYGHGAPRVARAALRGGASWLAVALVEEGVELRRDGIDAPILVLSEAPRNAVDALVQHNLRATVYSAEGATSVAAAVHRWHVPPVAVHVKVDTGMHRVGAHPDEVVDVVEVVRSDDGLRLEAVWTHLAVADEPEKDATTAAQLDRFDDVRQRLAAAGIDDLAAHAANTAGATRHERARLRLVRCGIGIYGYDPSSPPTGVDLRPAMSLKAQVSHVQRVAAGEGISYGHRYAPATDTVVATVPLGYADGVPRRLAACGGEVLVGGRRRPVAGMITMDQLMVDCGPDAVVERGDEVVLLGRQGDERITADDWARRLDTISYEILCGIGPRVPRVYVDEGGGS